ncbi:regulatory protein GemA [Rhodocyclus tenuis]|uniref:Phage gp16-like protein n=1 Tax=Rhodocyclus tenuis TaxID=1066 RepID=A0A840G788_RHOTE|nr:regulatory protein GemA [Rhodocyclus tenuis]MBB4247271.1 phage gp16-like protein [Rhodocyclus tenuis]
MKTSPYHRSQAVRRQPELAQIHIAKKDLGMADDTYRAILWSLGRVRSSADLDHAGRAAVLAHFRACGWKPKPPKAKPAAQRHKAPAATKEDISAKIAVQLRALDADWPYAYAVGRRIFPAIERWEFLSAEQLGKVSSALERTIRYRAANGAKP